MKLNSALGVMTALVVVLASAGGLRAQVDYQAGSNTFASGNTFTVTFPSPMPSTDYAVSIQPANTPAGFTTVNTCSYFNVTNKTTTGFQVALKKCHPPGNPVNATNLTFDWIAIAVPCVESPNVAFVSTLPAYTAAVASMTDSVLDFSLDCSGASTHALYAEVPGNFYEHCDLVTFTSWGVSNQYFPAGSCTPFRGQSLAYIGGIGADNGGPAIQSSAGGLNYTGYDAIEADFSATMKAVGFAVTALPQGGTLEIFGPSGTVTHTYALPASTSPAFYGVVGACIRGARIVPATLCSLVLNTSAWGITTLHFSR